MENPATWGLAERIVSRVLNEHRVDLRKSMDERVIGLSLERRITDALRKAGLLEDSITHG